MHNNIIIFSVIVSWSALRLHWQFFNLQIRIYTYSVHRYDIFQLYNFTCKDTYKLHTEHAHKYTSSISRARRSVIFSYLMLNVVLSLLGN